MTRPARDGTGGRDGAGVIASGMRPKLADKARLRHDRKTGRALLLYPERGLELSRTAEDILRLCTGEHTVDGIVDLLAARYAGQARAVIEREVHAFLATLVDRALVRDHAGG